MSTTKAEVKYLRVPWYCKRSKTHNIHNVNLTMISILNLGFKSRREMMQQVRVCVVREPVSLARLRMAAPRDVVLVVLIDLHFEVITGCLLNLLPCFGSHTDSGTRTLQLHRHGSSWVASPTTKVAQQAGPRRSDQCLLHDSLVCLLRKEKVESRLRNSQKTNRLLWLIICSWGARCRQKQESVERRCDLECQDGGHARSYRESSETTMPNGSHHAAQMGVDTCGSAWVGFWLL